MSSELEKFQRDLLESAKQMQRGQTARVTKAGTTPAAEARSRIRPCRLTRLRRLQLTIDEHHPRRAASIAAMSIFPICIIAAKARLAAARSGSAIASVRARGVICHDRPHLSLHQPQALS